MRRNSKSTMPCAYKTVLLILGMLIVIPFRAFGQAPTPALQFVTNIPIPNWTTTGVTAGNFDALWYNPANGVVYIADRVNDGATAVDTKTWTVLGSSVPPGCGIQTFASTGRPNCRPSGIIVTPDQKLVFTAVGPTTANPNAPPAGIWVYDLRAPQSAPVLIQTLDGPDFIDYNPVNQKIYLKTSPAGGDVVQVIDLPTSKVVGQINMGTTIEQIHFNPVDGLVYVATTESGKQSMAKVDPNTNAIVGSYPLQTSDGPCTPHQFEIDPVTDVAVIGCSQASVSMDLHNGNILSTYPTAGNADTTGFDMSLRHIYITGRGTTAAGGCPADSGKAIDTMGVVSTVAPSGGSPGQLVGVACGGRGQKGGVADSLNHNVYVAATQYPADPNSNSSGASGLLVFHDPAADVTGTPANTQQASSSTTLAAAGGSGISGSVTFSLRRRNMFVDGGLTGVAAGSTDANLAITTTAGIEVVHCGVNGSGNGFCQGRLVGDPLIGGVVDVGSGGKLAASGAISLGVTIPTFISTDSFDPIE